MTVSVWQTELSLIIHLLLPFALGAEYKFMPERKIFLRIIIKISALHLFLVGIKTAFSIT